MADLSPLAGSKNAEGRRLAQFWHEQIRKCDDRDKRWHKRGQSIIKRYRDERNRSEEEGQRRANYLWCNTQILLPAVYGKCPQPIAERRFKDKDPIGRTAATIIERALRNELEFDDFHDSVKSSILDYLLPGRGIVWVRYEPKFGQSVSIPIDSQNPLADDQGDIEAVKNDEDEEKLEDTHDRLIQESVPIDYIPWEDFYLFPAKARTWKEVRAVGKICYLPREDLVERFGDKVGEEIPLQQEEKDRRDSPEGRATDEKNDEKAHIYEIWDMDTRKLYWVAEGYEYLCNEIDDPLELQGFFPVPKPLFANSTGNTVVPVPFYIQYQDQARQIDELTQRISQLTKACKVAGTYNAASNEIARLLDESVENELIPVDNWQTFANNKGIEGQISLLPLDTIVKALEVLIEVKKSAVEEMDRLTGITDVLRGIQTDARETLGRGRLNNNNGKSRLREMQEEIARFCRDIIRIKAEIMCKHFQKMSLIDASGIWYEEGLDIADVSALKDMAGSMPPQGQPPQGMSMPPFLPAPMAQAQPQAPGQNVVPFPNQARPPALAPSPGGPAMGPGGQPPMPQPPGQAGPPPIPPNAMKILDVLKKTGEALKLLKDDHQRGFRVDIEVDSTIAADEEAEKEGRTEFVKAVTEYLGQAGQLGMAQPLAVPLLGKMLQFAVRGFRVGRDLENSIDEFTDQMTKKAEQMANSPPPPNPEMIKAQAQQQAIQQKGQLELQKAQMDMQRDTQSHQLEQQSTMVRAKAEEAQSQADMKMKQMEIQIEAMRVQFEKMRLHMEMQADQHKHSMDQAGRVADHQAHMQQLELQRQQANTMPG